MAKLKVVIQILLLWSMALSLVVFFKRDETKFSSINNHQQGTAVRLTALCHY
jgi:hypothetical protein